MSNDLKAFWIEAFYYILNDFISDDTKKESIVNFAPELVLTKKAIKRTNEYIKKHSFLIAGLMKQRASKSHYDSVLYPNILNQYSLYYSIMEAYDEVTLKAHTFIKPDVYYRNYSDHHMSDIIQLALYELFMELNTDTK